MALFATVKTIVTDARRLQNAPTVATVGFALRNQPTGMKKSDFHDDGTVRDKYMASHCQNSLIFTYFTTIRRLRRPNYTQIQYLWLLWRPKYL